MKATIVTMTRELAGDYLSKNIENRRIKKSTLMFYKNQMRSGKWKENGEPIIIDVNGVIKDGQHRLMSVVETGFSYRVPVISGVSSDVMDTIDTGSNRSASDVLEIEGFKYCVLLASLSKMIINEGSSYGESAKSSNTSNADILKFVKGKRNVLSEVCKEASLINALQVIKVLSPSILAYYIYTYGNTESTIMFLKNITGSFRKPKSATDYVFKKLMLSKNGDHRLSMVDKQKYIEKAYLYFTKGNPDVRSLNIKSI
jgi:hypothetical protein